MVFEVAAHCLGPGMRASGQQDVVVAGEVQKALVDVLRVDVWAEVLFIGWEVSYDWSSLDLQVGKGTIVLAVRCALVSAGTDGVLHLAG